MFAISELYNCNHSLFQRYLESNGVASWSEVWNFIQFLSIQLEDCEHCYYTDREIVDDESLPNFKEFIIRFMILMSKVFDTNNVTGPCTTVIGTYFLYLSKCRSFVLLLQGGLSLLIMLSLIVKKVTLKSSGIQGNSITRKLVVLLHGNSPCYSFSMENSNTSYVWMVHCTFHVSLNNVWTY